jgi:hypothetical protein
MVLSKLVLSYEKSYFTETTADVPRVLRRALLDTLKPFLIIIINQIILSDVLIFQRFLLKSSTLTNEINENLSLLDDGCSLLILVNNENCY